MNTRLSRLSPGDLGLFLGFVAFLISIPCVVFAFVAMGPGRTITLNGFMSYTFTGSLQPMWIFLAYPIVNGLGGLTAGFLISGFYNFYAALFGGISFDLKQEEWTHRRPAPDSGARRPI